MKIFNLDLITEKLNEKLKKSNFINLKILIKLHLKK